MLLLLVLIPLAACIAILAGAPAKKAAIGASVLNLFIAIAAAHQYISNPTGFGVPWSTDFLVFESAFGMPDVRLATGFLDGVSVVMTLLTVIVTVAAVFSGVAKEGSRKLWYTSTLLISAGAAGAFISTDLFFFYAFHELALIPTFLMIGVLGRGDRKEAAWKATIYLAFGSIILLAGLLWAVKGLGTFDMKALAAAPLEDQNGIALLLIIGFGSLVSLFPLHSWAAPAYACAPAPVAMLHAGVLKKFGLYGLIQVGLVVAPQGLHHWLNLLLVLLVCNIIWVGLVTINQKRLDYMLGNSSVMHMGYIFLAIAAVIAALGNGVPVVGSSEYAEFIELKSLAISAATLLMFAHGVSIAMSFALTEIIERKTKTLEINQLGGLAKKAPTLCFMFGLVGMASIGLPGLANFAGEVMVFFSGFAGWSADKPLGPVQIATIISIWGVVISAVYMLRAFKSTFQGETVKSTKEATDLTLIERAPAAVLGVVLLAVGLYPQIILHILHLPNK